jgi:hypothetical protein
MGRTELFNATLQHLCTSRKSFFQGYGYDGDGSIPGSLPHVQEVLRISVGGDGELRAKITRP